MATALPEHIQSVETNLKQLNRTRAIYTFIGLAAVLFILSSGVTVANNYNAGSFGRGVQNFFDYPVDLFEEAFAAGWSWFGLLLVHLPDLLSTINMAIFSTGVGAVFAVFLSLFSSQNLIKNRSVVSFTRRFMDLCRSFPELVIAMIFLYLMGKSLLPAVIAIVIHTSGALGKLFSEAIENIDQKPLEGLESVGASWWIRVRFGILPQVLPLFFSYSLLRLEINVRASTILGFVGAGGIGEALSTVIQWRYGDEILAIMTLLVLTIVALDYLSSFFRNQLIKGGA
ncbi:MAG: phosphonate ABC transporter, permease protein PhnE [Proteobacteria bacterium]|nr:phosphonate ABC transporter, permease protein PhnE [Pseudomonadota bacterium]